MSRQVAQLACPVLLALALISAFPTPAAASVRATVAVGTRSVRISPAILTFRCKKSGTGIPAYPNDVCTSNTVTIANGLLASQIYVLGANLAAAPGGKPWILCGGSGSACTGSGAKPGVNQYQASTLHAPARRGSGSTVLATTAKCDRAYQASAGCRAQANEAEMEQISVIGPKSSSSPIPVFSPIVTWFAVPP